MVIKLANKRIMPDSMSYVLSIVSLGCLLIVTGIASFGFTEWRKQSIAHNLDVNLSNGAWNKANNDYNALIYPDGTFTGFGKTLLSLVEGQEEPDPRPFKETFTVLGMVKSRNIDSGRLLFLRNRQTIAGGLARLQPSATTRPIPALKTLDEVLTYFEGYTEKHDALEQHYERTAELEETRGGHFLRLQQLARDTAAFFSLESAVEGDPNSDLDVYASGVLKDLPKMKNLPDGIETLNDLKKELSHAQGRVTVYGDNAYKEFQTRLAGMQTATRVIIAAREEVDTELAAIKTLVDNLRSEKREFRSEIESRLETMSVHLAFNLLNPQFANFLGKVT